MPISDIRRKAANLFTRRDTLLRKLAEVDAELASLRSGYMRETRTYGIHPEQFRREVSPKKAA